MILWEELGWPGNTSVFPPDELEEMAEEREVFTFHLRLQIKVGCVNARIDGYFQSFLQKVSSFEALSSSVKKQSGARQQC